MSARRQSQATRHKWVSFDCYGTLVDWQGGFARILKPLAGKRTPELLNAYHRYEPQVERQGPYRSYREVLIATLLLAARRIGLSFTPAQARPLPARWGSLRVFAEAENSLAQLRAHGVRLAVLTNCDDDLFAQTHRWFSRAFDLLVTAERVHDYKPALAHFRYFQSVTGVAAANWVHVGCSLFHDIEPAAEMGIRSIWLDRNSTSTSNAGACVRLSSATGLPEVILDLFGKKPPPLKSIYQGVIERSRTRLSVA